jgi:hypothetical protein
MNCKLTLVGELRKNSLAKFLPKSTRPAFTTFARLEEWTTFCEDFTEELSRSNTQRPIPRRSCSVLSHSTVIRMIFIEGEVRP